MTLLITFNLLHNACDWSIANTLDSRYTVQGCSDEPGEEAGEERSESREGSTNNTAVGFNAGPVASSDICPCDGEEMVGQLDGKLERCISPPGQGLTANVFGHRNDVYTTQANDACQADTSERWSATIA